MNVSTHSRAEAAAAGDTNDHETISVSTHSRAEAAAEMLSDFAKLDKCFNTQPRGGGCDGSVILNKILAVSTHSRAEAAASSQTNQKSNWLFQHTAARRRLRWGISFRSAWICFNTQPRGGGCFNHWAADKTEWVSTHSRAEAAARRSIK